MSYGRLRVICCLAVAFLAGCDFGEEAVGTTTQEDASGKRAVAPVEIAPIATLVTGRPIGSISAAGTKLAIAFDDDYGPACVPFLIWDAPSPTFRRIPTALSCDGDYPAYVGIALTDRSLFVSSTYAPPMSAATAWDDVRAHPLDGGQPVDLAHAGRTGEDGGTVIGALAVDKTRGLAVFANWTIPPSTYDGVFDSLSVASQRGLRRLSKREFAGTALGVEDGRVLLRRDGGKLVFADLDGNTTQELGRFRGPVRLAAGRVATLRNGTLHVLEAETGRVITRVRVATPGAASLLGFDGQLALYSRGARVRLLRVKDAKEVQVRMPDGADTIAELGAAGLFHVVDGDRVAFVPAQRLRTALAGSASYGQPQIIDAVPRSRPAAKAPPGGFVFELSDLSDERGVTRGRVTLAPAGTNRTRITFALQLPLDRGEYRAAVFATPTDCDVLYNNLAWTEGAVPPDGYAVAYDLGFVKGGGGSFVVRGTVAEVRRRVESIAVWNGYLLCA